MREPVKNKGDIAEIPLAGYNIFYHGTQLFLVILLVMAGTG